MRVGFRYNGVFQEVRKVKKNYEKNDTGSRFALPVPGWIFNQSMLE